MGSPALWLRNPLGALADGAGGGVLRDGRIEELVPPGGRPTAPDAAVFNAS